MGDPAPAARSALAAVVVGTLAALAAGCGGHPDAGPVHAGAQLDGPPPVRVLAAPPVPGATAAEIVRGFLRAQPGPGRRRGGRPVVPGGRRRPDLGHPADGRRLPGRVEPAHRRRPGRHVHRDDAGRRDRRPERRLHADAPPSTKATLKLKLVQVGGQWRISPMDDDQTRWLTDVRPGPGLRPDPALLRRRPAAGSWSRTCAGSRRRPGLATVVARAQLEPPPAYLRSAVITGHPAGTSLAVGSVPTVGGVATIDLTSTARQRRLGRAHPALGPAGGRRRAGPGRRRRSGCWPTASCSSCPDSRWPPVRRRAALGYSVDAAPSSSAIALSTTGGHSVLTQLASGDRQRPARRSRPRCRRSTGRCARWPAPRTAGSSPAWTRPGARCCASSTARPPRPSATPGGLTGPSYDPRRWLWTVSSGPGLVTRVHAVLDAPPAPRTSPTSSADRALARRPSGHGPAGLAGRRPGPGRRRPARAAGGSTSPAIQRDSRGKPVSLTDPAAHRRRASARSSTRPGSTPTSVAVLGPPGRADKSGQPYLVTIGARDPAAAAVTGAVGDRGRRRAETDHHRHRQGRGAGPRAARPAGSRSARAWTWPSPAEAASRPSVLAGGCPQIRPARSPRRRRRPGDGWPAAMVGWLGRAARPGLAAGLRRLPGARDALVPGLRRRLLAGPARPDPPRAPAAGPAAGVGGFGVRRGGAAGDRRRGRTSGRHDLTRPLAAALARRCWRPSRRRRPSAALRSAAPPVWLVPMPSRPAGPPGARAPTRCARWRSRAARLARRAGWAVRVAPALRHRRAVADQAGLTLPSGPPTWPEPSRCGRGWRGRRRRRAACLLVDDIITTGATLAEAARGAPPGRRSPVRRSRGRGHPANVRGARPRDGDPGTRSRRG